MPPILFSAQNHLGGVEKVTTYDVGKDGKLGDAPTSTTKSRLQYERPEVAQRTNFGK